MLSAVSGSKRQKNFSLIVHGDNNKFIRCKQKKSVGKEEEFIAGIGFYWFLLHNNSFDKRMEGVSRFADITTDKD